MSLVLETLICPKCKKKLKPNILLRKSIEILECRYCKICVKTSLLRTQKNPQAFLDRFKEIPEGTEIKKEEKYNMRLRKEHSENLKKYKHAHFPNKCPYCQSEDIVADCGVNSWTCLSCDSYFKWILYEVVLHGEVSVYATDEDRAKEKGYSYIGDKCRIDFESFVIREG